MAVWLYQMTVDKYSPTQFRHDVVEGNKTSGFYSHMIRSKSGNCPNWPDPIIFSFCPSGRRNPEPGIYGWGGINSEDKFSDEIQFTPTRPTDFLKIHPAWDSDVKSLLKDIRKPVFTGTMWEVNSDDWIKIQIKIGEWVDKIDPDYWENLGREYLERKSSKVVLQGEAPNGQ